MVCANSALQKYLWFIGCWLFTHKHNKTLVYQENTTMWFCAGCWKKAWLPEAWPWSSTECSFLSFVWVDGSSSLSPQSQCQWPFHTLVSAQMLYRKWSFAKKKSDNLGLSLAIIQHGEIALRSCSVVNSKLKIGCLYLSLCRCSYMLQAAD